MRRSSVAALLLVATAAFAQSSTPVPEFRLERFSFNSGTKSALTAASGDLLDKGQLQAMLGLHYEHNPLVLLTDGKRAGALVANRLTAHLLVGYGITSYLHVTGEFPIIAYQHGDALTGIRPVDPAGISTPILNARMALLSQQAGGLALQNSFMDLALQLGAVLPLATGSTLSREFAFVPQISGGHAFERFRLGGEVAVWVRPSNLVLGNSEKVQDSVGHQLSLRVVGTTKVAERLGLELSVNAGFPLGGGVTPVGVELLAGARYPIWPVEVFLIAGPGFGALPGTPAFRVLAGVGLAQKNACVEGEKHAPADCPELDDDRDGLNNKLDRCPLQAEDADGFEDADGCPDLDDDADGIVDTDDACRLVPGVREERGCPIKDSDKDGVPDKTDACPKTPGLKALSGCPDADKDGITDADDQCPMAAGIAQFHGCPDQDGDGIEDTKDLCPTEPGPVERKGCPLKDRDADTVEDALDNCPDVKGDPANQGCPKAEQQLVVITREKLIIKDKIFFATGKAVILPKSFPLLNQVAKVLNEHQELAGIAIEGHTDNVGKRENNVKLSQARAESVKAFLMEQKVDGTRLRAVGYGPDKPADTNLTAAGKANNRRVEFVIETAETIKTQEIK